MKNIAAFLAFLVLLSFFQHIKAVFPTYNATAPGRGWVYSQTCSMHYDGCKLNNDPAEYEKCLKTNVAPFCSLYPPYEIIAPERDWNQTSPNCIYHYNNCKLNNDPRKFEECLRTNVEPLCSLKVTTTTSTTKATTTTVVTTTTANPTTTTTVAQPCCNRPPNTAAVFIPTASISPNGIIMKQANGSCPRSSGADYFYSPQPSTDAEDLFFNEKDNVHSVCEGMCVCDIQNNCYQYPQGSTNGIWLFSICETDGCFMKAFNPTFTPLTNVVNGNQIDSNDQYVNPNQLKPLTDPAYFKVSKIGCGGCSALAAVALCPIIPITTTTVASTTTTIVSPATTTTTLPATTTTLVSTTTTAPAPCIQPVNTSAIYVPNDSISNEKLLMFENYTASCPCEDGTELYFPSVNTSDTVYIMDNNLINILIGCQNLCVCDINNNCYHFINETIASVALISFCEIDGCFMRGFIVSFVPLYNVATNATISQDDQYIGDDDSKPLTDPIFLKFSRISCMECPIPQNTCQSNSTTTLAPISSTSTLTTTTTKPIQRCPTSSTILPNCEVPKNTSAFSIPTPALPQFVFNEIASGICNCTESTQFHYCEQTILNSTEFVFNRNELVYTTCEDMCVCDINNRCFQFPNGTTGGAFWLYSTCGNSAGPFGCLVKGFNPTNISLISYDFGLDYVLDPNDQYIGPNLLKPFTDEAFMKVSKIDCGAGCERLLSFRPGYFPKCGQPTVPPVTTTIPSTTTTVPLCIPPENISAIYVDSMDSLEIETLPSDTCECATIGKQLYFTPGNSSNTNDLVNNGQESFYTFCSDLCICDSSDICYKYVNPTTFPAMYFYSYCSSGVCSLFGVNLGNDDLINADNSGQSLTIENQYIDEFNYKPITDSSAYLKVSKLSCSGCSSIQSSTCPKASVTTSESPTSTTTFTTTTTTRPF